MHKSALLFSLLCCLVLTASCIGDKVYDSYYIVTDAKWAQKDTLHFSIPQVSEDGIYENYIGIRLTDKYPYASLTLKVKQQFFPTEITKSKIAKCTFVDEHGIFNGVGVGLYEYMFLVNTVKLNKGDSIQVDICHILKTDTIPQITEIGYILQKQSDDVSSIRSTAKATEP